MSFNLDSEFYCTSCGNRQIFSIPRMAGKGRPAGHLKRMFCFTCNTEHNFVECKPCTKYDHSDFLLEYTYKNFDEKGNRKLDYGLFRAKIHNEGVDLHEFE